MGESGDGRRLTIRDQNIKSLRVLCASAVNQAAQCRDG